MPEQVLASELTEEHVGRLVCHNLFNGILLAIEHGGPFPVPDTLPSLLKPYVSHTIPPSFTEQLQIRPLLAGYPRPGAEPDPFYAWLVPGEVVTIEESDHA